MKALYSMVGMQHRDAVAFVSSLPRGEPLTLIREPTNQYDPNAVQVWARDRHVGFVKATQARALAMRIDRDGQPFARPEPVTDKPSTNESVQLFMSMKAKLATTADRWPMIEVEE